MQQTDPRVPVCFTRVLNRCVHRSALMKSVYLVFFSQCISVCFCVRAKGAGQCSENRPFGNNSSIIENPLFRLLRTGCPRCNVITAITVATGLHVNKVEEGSRGNADGGEDEDDKVPGRSNLQ